MVERTKKTSNGVERPMCTGTRLDGNPCQNVAVWDDKCTLHWPFKCGFKLAPNERACRTPVRSPEDLCAKHQEYVRAEAALHAMVHDGDEKISALPPRRAPVGGHGHAKITVTAWVTAEEMTDIMVQLSHHYPIESIETEWMEAFDKEDATNGD